MKRSSWFRTIFNWTPEGKDPVSSVMAVIPFISLSESALRIFLIFLPKFRVNTGLNMT